MILYLIKNNFKLMMRSATNIMMYIVGPVLLVALLSTVFNDLLEKYESEESISAGYAVSAEASDVRTLLLSEQVKAAAGESDIVLTEYPAADPEKILREEDLSGFIVFEDGGRYTVYENGEHKYGAKALEYLVSSVDQRITGAVSVVSETGSNAVSRENTMGSTEVDIEISHPDYMEAIDSTDYYGIIEVVYFGWCAILCGTGILTAEKKYHIGKKLKVSGLSETKLYLAKFIPMLLVVSISSLITAAATIALFGVHWGSPLLSALIVVLSAAAATAFGLMFYSITQNSVVTIIGVFAAVWLAGFFGGSFETYMFSSHSAVLKNITPIYHINRALTELSCMGRSEYVGSAVLYCVLIIIVSSFIALGAGDIRRRTGR
ncbi:MAG: ABC transporter permease [Lachnospiraceae bacterium]|nr:ABC transporter permease [Lachnospiraceae bacterium]